MAAHAKILLVGTLLATVTFAGAAISQDTPTTLVIEQVDMGDVFAGQTLNVEDGYGQTVVTAAAVGNSSSGAVENGALDLTLSQSKSGNARASITVNAASSVGEGVALIGEAVGNSSEAGAYGANLNATVTQSIAAGSEITAGTGLFASNGQLYGGGNISSTAIGNSQAFGASDGEATYAVTQDNAGLVQAQTGAVVKYMPTNAVFSAAAVANNVSASGSGTAQTATIVQNRTGTRTQAATYVSAGNAWDVTGAAVATANNIAITNTDGPLHVSATQNNETYVRAEAVVSPYEFGVATASAYGVGNSSLAGNQGEEVTFDNDQTNNGGVEVIASFNGNNGYDAYSSATAIGNAVTGYACSDCQATLNATSRQVNESNVSATSTMTVGGVNRNNVGTSNAVGNSATFYVTRP
jgi:hypothetical protein